MRLYNNIGIAFAYLFGKGARNSYDKLQNTIDNRDSRKEIESAIQYLSNDEEERRRRDMIMIRREKWALRCLLIAVICIISGCIALPSFPILSMIILLPVIPAVLYGLWYSLFGKY